MLDSIIGQSQSPEGSLSSIIDESLGGALEDVMAEHSLDLPGFGLGEIAWAPNGIVTDDSPVSLFGGGHDGIDDPLGQALTDLEFTLTSSSGDVGLLPYESVSYGPYPMWNLAMNDLRQTADVLLHVDEGESAPVVYHRDGVRCMDLNRTVYFDFDKSELKPAAEEALRRLANGIGECRINLGGHTDNIGTDKYNFGLGLRRAEAVSAFLQEQGWPAEAMHLETWGESAPVRDNATPEGRALNRRVELVLSTVK